MAACLSIHPEESEQKQASNLFKLPLLIETFGNLLRNIGKDGDQSGIHGVFVDVYDGVLFCIICSGDLSSGESIQFGKRAECTVKRNCGGTPAKVVFQKGAWSGWD